MVDDRIGVARLDVPERLLFGRASEPTVHIEIGSCDSGGHIATRGSARTSGEWHIRTNRKHR